MKDRGHYVVWAAAGFLLGAAALAGGDENDGLREKLRQLQVAAGRLIEEQPAPIEYPVRDDGLHLAALPVADLVSGVPQHPHPASWEVDTETVLHSGPLVESWQTYGTTDEVTALVRTTVSPASWENDGAAIQSFGTSLFVRNKPIVLQDVRRFLDEQLRPPALASILHEAEIVDVAPDLARALVASGRKTLGKEMRARVDDALASGDADRHYAGRVLALNNQQVLLWHGAEVSLVDDADVEVAVTSATTDPVIAVHRLGHVLVARGTLGDGGKRVFLRLSLESDEPIGTHVRKAKLAGELQLPRTRRSVARMQFDVASGAWAVATVAKTDKEKTRVVLVRATVQPRGGLR